MCSKFCRPGRDHGNKSRELHYPAYIGQSWESVLQRTVRTFDKSLAARKSGQEPIIVQAFRNTDRWWSKWVIIPLEVIPSPNNSTSAGNKEFLQKFRSMAIVREQAWIRELHAGFPHGYNIEVHFPGEKTQERYQQSKHSGKPKKKRSQNGWRVIRERGIPVPDPLRTKPDYSFNPNTGVPSFSTEAGHSASIRRDLARFVQTDDDPVERNEFLDTLSRSKIRRLQNWLAVNQPPQDGTVQNLFQQLILALDNHRKNDSSHRSHGIFQSYNSTAPAEQEKKQRKKTDADAVQWLKIPGEGMKCYKFLYTL